MSRKAHRSHGRKKSSKVTAKNHRKNKPQSKDEWQKLFRERFYV